MPMPRSWVEELVAEYYMLRGFTVNFDVPIGTGVGGGRRDLDVVAVNIAKKEIHIIDITNIWSGTSDRTVEGIIDRLDRAINIISEWYGQDYRYIKKAILLGEPWRPKMQEIIDDLKQKGIEAQNLRDFILEILRYIDEWRNEMIMRRIVSENTTPALPDMLYMLKLLEYMKSIGMIVQ